MRSVTAAIGQAAIRDMAKKAAGHDASPLLDRTMIIKNSSLPLLMAWYKMELKICVRFAQDLHKIAVYTSNLYPIPRTLLM